MQIHPQEGIVRSTAMALLGAFLFLLVASFLALPCLASDAGLFRSSAGPQACHEHKLFQAQADLSKVASLPAEAVFRFLIALPVAGASAALIFAFRAAAGAKFRSTIRPRSGTLPFATSDPPRLPAFAALRDA
ncbi:MAG TPA: hypothetical protein VJ694_00755 [Patescibacteria group bacterium]|nr:hypothetical protein [Patescibacteria group bacterium]